jgi:hypothetical protein
MANTGPIDDFLYTVTVEPCISAKDEYLLYRKALANHILNRSELENTDIKIILKAREEGLAAIERQISRIKRGFREPSAFLVNLFFSHGPVDVRRSAVENLRGLLEGLRKRGMRMYREAQIRYVCRHLNSQNRFCDHLTGTGAHDTGPQNPLCLRIHQQFGQSLVPAQGGSASRKRPKESG